MRFRALDHGFTLHTTDPGLQDALERLLGALASGEPPTTVYSWLEEGLADSRRHRVFADAELLVCTERGDTALEHLLWRINRDAIASTPHLVLLHAGAAEWEDSAMILPGASGAGKTTLVAGLVRHGLRYLSDEVAAVDPASLAVRPFPKPLSVKAGSWEVLDELAPTLDPALTGYLSTQWQVDPRRIRSDSLGDAAPARWIIAPEYRAGAATALVPLRPGEALLTLARNTFELARHGQAGLETLAAVARSAAGYRLVFDGLDEACVQVRWLLDRNGIGEWARPGPSSRAERVHRGAAGPVGARTTAGTHRAPGRPDAEALSFMPRRRDAVVSVEIDGEAVLLDTADGALHHLDPVGAAVWSRLDGELPLERLALELSGSFGADQATIGADLLAFTADLTRLGLLSEAGPDGGGDVDHPPPSGRAGMAPISSQ